MSTLNVTNVKTSNGSTDLYLNTGNSSGPGIIVNANGNALVIQSNSTVNSISVNTTVTTIAGGMTVSGAANVTGNVVISGTANVAGNTVISGTANVAGNTVISGTANVTGNVTSSGNINAAAANFSTNTLNLGTSSIGSTAGANGYSRLPNGLLLQWMSGSNNSINTTSGAVTSFPIAFNTLFGATATESGTDTGKVIWITSSNSTTVTLESASSANRPSFFVMAIGI